MKKKKQKNPAGASGKKQSSGLAEFLAAVGVLAVFVLLALFARSCGNEEQPASALDNDAAAETAESASDYPDTTELNPIMIDGVELPVTVTSGITVDNLYTATGYYPEDGTDEGVENVLAAKFTNTSDRTLEYLTAVLTVNGEAYNFAVTTIPAGASVYVYNADRKTAPSSAASVTAEAGYELYFAEEPTTQPENLEYDIQNGTIVVKNISGEDITSDIVVYYKSKAENGYLGGITYRFTVSGGLGAGETYNAYAPHSYVNMTEIVFAQCE